ncbi:MAG: hypothetical protein AAF713_21970 [Pseudomonadota bacterium]
MDANPQTEVIEAQPVEDENDLDTQIATPQSTPIPEDAVSRIPITGLVLLTVATTWLGLILHYYS